jgi:hypothetical protein
VDAVAGDLAAWPNARQDNQTTRGASVSAMVGVELVLSAPAAPNVTTVRPTTGNCDARSWGIVASLTGGGDGAARRA